MRLKWDYRYMEYPGDDSIQHPHDTSLMSFTGHRVLRFDGPLAAS